MNITNFPSCAVALKEWAATCAALREGRQIILLRKGGLLDEDGVFHLEYQNFWLLPTQFHQDPTLVRPEHRDLLNFDATQPQQKPSEIVLRLFAHVAQVWSVREEEADKLQQAPHIWSKNYLDGRFAYKPQQPLLCIALRCFTFNAVPHTVPARSEYFGCRSWIELEAPLPVTNARPVVDDENFAAQLAHWNEILPA